MSGRIPQEFINDLLERVDIIDIIQSRVKLIKRGQNHHGLCPFHQEKTPSFTANQAKQFYYCFGCSASGNAIGFVMQYDQVNFRETVEQLAQKVGLTLPTEMEENNTPEYTELYNTMKTAANFYQQQLRTSPDAIEYLKSRGLNGQIAKTFKIGFVKDGWNHLSNAINQPTQLLATGMITQKNERSYDRFRHRVMFPIHDVRGRIVGFGGRSIDNTPPKYLNSPETVIFHKNNELFGLYETRQQSNKPPYLIVVEGYMDVIALHQHNIPQAVATLGTAINKKHIQKLLKYTPTLIFCFDGDRAGQQAAWKALCTSLPFLRDDICIKLFTLPQEHDPDSLVRSIGSAQFNASIEAAPEITSMLFTHLEKEFPLDSISNKSRYAKKAMELINTMPHGIYQQLLTQSLAEKINVNIDEISQLIDTNNKPQQQPPRTQTNTEQPTTDNIKQQLPEFNLNYPLNSEMLACSLLTQRPSLATEISPESHNSIAIKQSYWLNFIFKSISKVGAKTTGQLLQHTPPELQPYIIKLAQTKISTQEEHMLIELNGAINKIKTLLVQKEINKLISKAKQAPLEAGEQEQLKELLHTKTQE
jgi:DNA primase